MAVFITLRGGRMSLTRSGGAVNIYLNQSPTVTSIIWGDGVTDGSWRIVESGNNLSVQRLEEGQWIEKSDFTP